jgi:glycosyltransferase involved in cell wall biosynthesis
MRIAYLHYLYGEDTAHHHVRQLAAAARELGHEVAVHAMNLAPPPAGAAAAPALAARARRWLKRRGSRWLHEPKELLWNAPYLRRELALLGSRPRPDVLLVRDHALTASAVPVASCLGLPLVLEFNAPARELGLYFDEYVHYPLLADWLEGWKLRRAGAVTAVSGALKDYLVARHRLAPERIAVVPNGVDLAAFRPAADGEVGSPGAAIVGFVGSFQRFHGADLLAEMALQVAAARPAVRFLFVGDGPQAAAVRRRTAPLGDRVRFTGLVPHAAVPELVSTFDIGVLPESSFYASPLKVVEWMAAGKAVVAPRRAPLAELLADGDEGLLFPPRDLAALVAAVLRLVDLPELRRSLGRAAAARARRALSWRENARQVAAVCEEAIGRAALAARPAPGLAPGG